MNDINWFHSIKLSNGAITPGKADFESSIKLADIVFSKGLKGKSVLDIGAWDGFFSFEAEKRGAKKVLATDYFCWSGPGWGTKEGFNFAQNNFQSKVESLEIDLKKINLNSVGAHDVVLFLGVFYHLENPISALKKVFEITNEYAVIETTISKITDKPVMEYHYANTFGNDNTNFWSPTTKCLEQMLLEIGFKQVDFEIDNPYPNRCTAHAYK